MSLDAFSFARPFDAHVHARQGGLLNMVGPMTARQYWGAIFEPNLQTPITTPALGRAYRTELLVACAEYPEFRPYVLAYLTDTMDPEDLAQGLADHTFIGAKFYPKGATTLSDSGILDVSTLWTPGTRQYDLMRVLAESGKVIQLHCELNTRLNGEELDPYDKEPYFFEHVMPRLLEVHPDARWSCEHLTCLEGVNFMQQHGGPLLGCSITPHHLLYDRRDMFRGGLRPHLFCLPVIKRFEHKMHLVDLATSGKSFVYAGTDSAPHDRRKKECDCCSGGIFTAHASIEMYAEVFDASIGLDYRFERFMSINGPTFYNLPASEEEVTIERTPWTVDKEMQYSEDPLDVLRPHGYEKDPKERMVLSWKFKD